MGPDLFDGVLDVGTHFEVVHAEASGGIRRGRGAISAVKLVGEEAVDLLDAAFVHAFFRHDFEEDGEVERHDGNGRTGLGDDCLLYTSRCV